MRRLPTPAGGGYAVELRWTGVAQRSLDTEQRSEGDEGNCKPCDSLRSAAKHPQRSGGRQQATANIHNKKSPWPADGLAQGLLAEGDRTPYFLLAVTSYNNCAQLIELPTVQL